MYYYKITTNSLKLLNCEIKKIIILSNTENDSVTVNNNKIYFNDTKTIEAKYGMYITDIDYTNPKEAEIEIISEKEIESLKGGVSNG